MNVSQLVIGVLQVMDSKNKKKNRAITWVARYIAKTNMKLSKLKALNTEITR